MNFISKIFVGNSICRDDLSESPLTRRVKNLKAIWNHEDYGIERVVRLLLALSQFVFPGTYIRQVFGRNCSINRDLTMDGFVVFKIVYSILFVYLGWYNYTILLIIMLWFMLETITYIPTLVFASDYMKRPRSYKRSMILFFLNYVEISIDYSGLYTLSRGLNKPFEHWFDAIYYSFVTGSSTGYGDYYPVTWLGEVLVVSQTVIFMIFVALFINIFSSKLETKGYFDKKD